MTVAPRQINQPFNKISLAFVVAPRQSSSRRDRQNGIPDPRRLPIQIVALQKVLIRPRFYAKVQHDETMTISAVTCVQWTAAEPNRQSDFQQIATACVGRLRAVDESLSHSSDFEP
jgi:hypothetical protein